MTSRRFDHTRAAAWCWIGAFTAAAWVLIVKGVGWLLDVL
jgi:hypothetical protein